MRATKSYIVEPNRLLRVLVQQMTEVEITSDKSLTGTVRNLAKNKLSVSITERDLRLAKIWTFIFPSK